MYYTETGKLICPLQTHLFLMSYHHQAAEKKGQFFDFFIFLFQVMGMLIAKLIVSTFTSR